VFLSLEDETGIANIIVEPETGSRASARRWSANRFLVVEGALQNQDRVVSVKAPSRQPAAGRRGSASLTISTRSRAAVYNGRPCVSQGWNDSP